MDHLDPNRAPIESLQRAMGKAIDEAIDKQGGKVAFAKKAGLNRATLYRLLAGENVSTQVLLRALRALGRAELLTALIAAPEPSPLELRPPVKKRPRRGPSTQPPPSPPGTLVRQLAIGRLPNDTPHG